MTRYLGGMEAEERSAAEFRLRRLADLMGVDHVTYPWHGPGLAEHVRQAIPGEDLRSHAPVREALDVVRGMIRKACKSGALPWEAMEAGGLSNLAVSRPVVRNPREGRFLAVRRCLTEGEMAALIGVRAWDPSSAGVRDLAVICAVYAAGLTGLGVAELRPDDWRRESSSLSMESGRLVLLGRAAAEAVAAWAVVRSKETEGMFYGVDPCGTVQSDTFGPEALTSILKRRSREASIERVSAADLRCTAMHALLRAGLAHSVVRVVLGWPDEWRANRGVA